MKLQAMAVMFGLLVGAGQPLLGQTPPAGQTPTDSTKPMTHATMGGDETFAQKAASGGSAEVALAALAQQKASNDTVKQLAARIQSDHTKANQALASLGSEKGWKLTAEPTAEQAATMKQLEQLSGPAFDRAYVQAMVKDHQKDIKAFEHEAASGSDSAVKQFAATALPDLKEHLEMALAAQKAVAKP
jgi:putative membrane protein